MAAISERQLATWTKPAFGNEREQAKQTAAKIEAAIAGHDLLGGVPVKTYAKGSYKNNTNVRRDSDIDIAVEYTGMITSRYAKGTEEEAVRRERGTRPYSGPFRGFGGGTARAAFKDAVGEALEEQFGAGAVRRSNKVFTVRESPRSLAADVVPCNTMRRYSSPQSWRRGIRLIPDRPGSRRIINYPRRHFLRGVAKNKATRLRFKSVVRILKNLENQLAEEGESPEVASYLIECLVFNAPKQCFLGLESWRERTRAVLLHIWEDTAETESERRWMEVNSYKYLFGAHQNWTREEAREFAAIALEAIGDC